MTTPDNKTPGGAANDATFQTAGGGSPSGLTLDLSKVQQVAQAGATEPLLTTAYRERIVPGSDEGYLQTFSPVNANQYAARVADSDGIELLRMIACEARRQTILLVNLFNTMTDETVEVDDLDVHPQDLEHQE